MHAVEATDPATWPAEHATHWLLPDDEAEKVPVGHGVHAPRAGCSMVPPTCA